jgi:two-component system NtrC family response regulator
LFLDEVNSLPLELQPKLLRALETCEVWPVGAAQPDQSQARVVAAANSDLQHLVASGRFREDLFYRLNVLAVTLPSLRSRMEDVPSIAAMIIERECTDGRMLHLASDTIADLLGHSWPGNVRELENKIKGAVIMADGKQVTAADLGLSDVESREASSLNLREVRQHAESKAIRIALMKHFGNISRAAEQLGVTRPTLYDLLNKYGLSAEAYSKRSAKAGSGN